jgi:hypothetical protein
VVLKLQSKLPQAAAMMAQMDRTSNNNSVAAAPMGVQGVQCPPGQVFNPVTNSCEPAPTDYDCRCTN